MTDPAPLPTASFGRTGHESTRTLFGAAALGAMSQERADATLDVVHRWGINHIDTAASYGESELRLAPWLVDHRSEVFLATKTGERSGPAARAELERSLERLGVDQVDLIQLHNLVEDDEWEQAHAPGGALEAMVQARDEGLVRFIGVTGHGVRIAGMHSRSLAEFDYDSVLLPYNVLMFDNPVYRHDFEALVTTCGERNVAVQTIKSIARGRWGADANGPKFSWYEPITDPDAIALNVRWVLSDERVFLNTSSDARLLGFALAAAAGDLSRPSEEEMAAMMSAQNVSVLFDGADLERI
jgi:aryl-alcohol dehydrogenase-like predicted oxidoreductase